MSKCIQFKLPTTASDDLPYVGGWNFSITGASIKVIFAKADNPIKVVPNAGVTVGGSSDPKVITPDGSGNVNFSISGTGTFDIVKGYFNEIKASSIGSDGGILNYDSFQGYYAKLLEVNSIRGIVNPKSVDNIVGVCKNVKSLHISRMLDTCDGDFSVLEECENVEKIAIERIWNNHIYGDIANILPNGGSFSALFSDNSFENEFTWSERKAGYGLLVLRKINLGDSVDKYLIDISAEDPITSDYASTAIDINGTRTSASDSAVTAIKAKGITIKVNGTDL